MPGALSCAFDLGGRDRRAGQHVFTAWARGYEGTSWTRIAPALSEPSQATARRGQNTLTPLPGDGRAVALSCPIDAP